MSATRFVNVAPARAINLCYVVYARVTDGALALFFVDRGRLVIAGKPAKELAQTYLNLREDSQHISSVDRFEYTSPGELLMAEEPTP